MTGTEEQVSAGLRRLAVEHDAAPPALDDLVRRGRRTIRTRVVAGTVTAGVIGIAGAVGLTVGMTGAPATQQTARAAAPHVDLVAAARTTSDSSFQFTTRFDAPGNNGPCVGGMDPTGKAGWESDRSHETRLVDGVQYVKMRGQDWHYQPGVMNDSFDCVVAGMAGSVDPKSVLTTLRDKGTVTYAGRRGSGADATDVFAFSYQYKKHAPTYFGYRGQITVGVKSGYVQHISNTLITEGRAAGTQTVVYSHVGEPVTVSRPAKATPMR